MSKKKAKKKKLSLIGVVDVIAIGLVVATVFGFLGRFNWFLDLFSHFRVQYMQLCLPIIGIYLWKRMNIKAVAAIALAVINYSLVLPFYFGKPDAPTAKPTRAMLMNILAINGNSDEVLEAIKNTDPDILVLEEFTPKWAEKLTVLDKTYPHKVSEPQTGCFGIILLSKHPLKTSKVIEVGDADVPTIVTDVYLPDGDITVIATHPLPPLSGSYSKFRNTQLAALPTVIQEQEKPVLLIGDLNASPWSSHFQTLEKESGLNNSMKGFGFQPSWPKQLPFFKIPIDHMLHSDEIIIHNRMIGQGVGSDHLPVIVDFSVR